MLPATSPSETIVFKTFSSTPMILCQCSKNGSRSRAGNAAISTASGSSWCSKNTGRSSSITSRSTPAITRNYAAPRPFGGRGDGVAARTLFDEQRAGEVSGTKTRGGSAMAAQRSRGKSGSKGRSGSRNGSGSAARARSASKLDTGHLEGREPSHDPDVFVDVNKVHVDEIYV